MYKILSLLVSHCLVCYIQILISKGIFFWPVDIEKWFVFQCCVYFSNRPTHFFISVKSDPPKKCNFIFTYRYQSIYIQYTLWRMRFLVTRHIHTQDINIFKLNSDIFIESPFLSSHHLLPHYCNIIFQKERSSANKHHVMVCVNRYSRVIIQAATINIFQMYCNTIISILVTR